MPGTVTVRNLVIGEGIPKIIVPILGKTASEIYEAAREIRIVPADIAEWRADFFADSPNPASVLKVLKELRDILGDMPLIFTFRTAKEGGEKSISLEEYEALNFAAAKSGFADIIDVEIFSGDDEVKRMVEAAHNLNCKVIGSNHDFQITPEKHEIISRLSKMRDMDADILKIAVMPNSAKDVLTLLEAASEMSEKYAGKPILAISMSDMGAISRIAAQAFGSALTFGSAGKTSAPGQLPATELSAVLKMLHK